jgi:hypothetical protein
MNPKVKTKWLEALRSGEYRQARHRLRDDNDDFCCLGVLCDIYTKEVGGSWEWEHSEHYDKGGAYKIVHEDCADLVTTSLPFCVREWAGLELSNPGVHVAKGDSDFVPTTLAQLNDGGKGFDEIADIIEHQL